MVINFAQLTVFGFFFASIAYGATTVEKPGVCNEVLESSQLELPPGFGLSKKDIALAITLSQVAELTMAVEESIHFLATLPADDFFAVTSDYLQFKERVGEAISVDEIPVRQFPNDFYDKNLTLKNVDEALVQAQFQRLNINLSKYKLSDNALALLAFASRSFHSVTLLREVQNQQLLQAAQNYIRKLYALNHLPIFKDFFSEDQMFIALAEFIHYSAIKSKGAPFQENDFAQRLRQELLRRGAISIEEKIKSALNLMDPSYRELAQKSGFAWLLASGSQVKKIDKWLNLGSHFLTYRMSKIMMMAQTMNFKAGEEPFDFFVNELCTSLSQDPNSREFKFFSEALVSVWLEIARVQTIDPRMLISKIKAEIFALSRQIREALKENQRETVRLHRQAQAEHSVEPYPVVIVKKKGEREAHIGGKGKARAARREALRVQQEASALATSKPVLLDGALAVHEIQNNAALVEPGQLYYFEKFVGSGNNRQYIRLTEAFLFELRRRQQDLAPWIRHFLTGTSQNPNASGMTRVKGSSTRLWAIKGLPGYRVLVQQDKSTRIWTWLSLLTHDKVDEYRMNHQL